MAEPIKSRNLRTGLVLGTVALAFFLGVIIKYLLLK
jgi:hypothetical protein